MTTLNERITEKKAVLAVVGLGSVGLGSAVCFAEAGFMVIGLDVDADKVGKVNAGTMPFDEIEPDLPELLARVTAEKKLVAVTSYAALAEADAILVAVETPIGRDLRPSFDSLETALEGIARDMKDGALVVIESTLAPGTCTSLVVPLLEKSGKAFALGHCPERSAPGRVLANARTLPRVVGAATPETCETIVALYRTVTSGRLDCTDLVTAEIVKTAENAYRDVNIAFANELALVCEHAGAQFPHVRELINHLADRTVLWAGPGVGGHKMPKDSWLLAAGAPGVDAKLVATARQVNDAMPVHVAHLLEEALEEAGIKVHKATIVILGHGYRENSGDTRGSPTDALLERIRDWKTTVKVHDPFVPGEATDVLELVTGAHAVVIMCAHDPYLSLDLEKMKSVMAAPPVLVDARHMIRTQAARDAGFVFRGLGRGKRS